MSRNMLDESAEESFEKHRKAKIGEKVTEFHPFAKKKVL